MAGAVATLAPRDDADTEHTDSPARPSRLGPAACLAWITLAAVLIDLGEIHRQHQADSIVPALESVYRWEPYYWEQNRYGMLVALVASPVRNPFHNLLLQNGITIWLGLAAFPLAVRYLRGATCQADDPAIGDSWRDGLIAAGIFALIASKQFQWIYLSTYNVFSTSLALGLAALILLERIHRARVAAAVVLLGLAAWTNSAIGALLLFLVAGLTPMQNLFAREQPPAARGERRRRIALQALLCLAAVVAGLEVFGRIPPPQYYNTFLKVPSLDKWARLIADVAWSMWDENRPMHAWVALVAVCGAAVGIAALRDRPGAARAAGMFALVSAATCGFACAMGILFEGRWRYSAPAMVVVHAAAVAAVVSSLPPLARRAAGALPLLLLAAIPWQHGLPSYEKVRSELRTNLEVGYYRVVDAGCTHVAGDYWRVWPAVFAANWRLHEEGSERTVWGLAHRCTPTEAFWRSTPTEEIRAATFADDPEGPWYLGRLAERWTELERRDPLVIHGVRK
jgi:hypothetical protein